MKFKKLAILLLIFSAGLSLAGDLIYGSKSKAEEYLFGNFMANLSNFGYTIFSIIVLISLMILVFRMFGPKLINRIMWDAEVQKEYEEVKKKRNKNKNGK